MRALLVSAVITAALVKGVLIGLAIGGPLPLALAERHVPPENEKVLTALNKKRCQPSYAK